MIKSFCKKARSTLAFLSVSQVFLLSTGVSGFAILSNQVFLQPGLSYRQIPASHQRFSLQTIAVKSDTNTDFYNDMEKRPSSLSLPWKLGGLYGLLGAITWNGVRKHAVSPMEATAGIGVLWMGFVLAISFMEAPVKFQAPFLPKHHALDVGRTVFPVLNAIEMAFCFTLWLINGTTTRSWSEILTPLSAVTIILLSQVLYLTPQLVLLGKHVIRSAFLTPDPKWTPHQEEVYHELSMEVKNKPRPSGKIHIVYVLEEFVKIIMLGTMAWKCRGL